MALYQLDDGQSVVIPTYVGERNLTVITGAGATATISRVDDIGASAHTTGAENQFTVAATTRTVTAIDWPYYRISVAGGACRVSTT
jgi:hypothetical protein